jgi:microcystin degradation protein MlrC
MRFASGGISHETNTFATHPTTLEDFIRDSGGDPDFPPQSIVARFAGSATIHGGYLDAAASRGVEMVPLLLAAATPGGTVQAAAYRHLKTILLERLQAAMPVDGVLLDLHGAMVTETHEDAESDLIAAVRDLVGAATPIVATLDLHANITPRMADLADVLIGFDTYPHVDMGERGAEALHIIADIAAGKVKPTMAYRQLPLLTMPPLQCTLRQPMQSLLERLHALEREPGVLTATLSMGFPFADIHDAGVSVLVTTDGDPDLAESKAQAFADEVWRRRTEFNVELTPVRDVLRYVREKARGLVVLADGSDNPGGGAPCDGTVILQTLLDEGAEDAVVGILYDPETVAQAHRAGVGTTIDAVIGGKTDRLHGDPVHTRAYVRVLSDGEFVYRGPMGRGLKGHLGRTAVLVIGGVEVVVAERRQQLRDAEMLRCVGIDPRHRRLLAVKSAVHFRADIGPLAERIFDADTPGVHRPDFAGYTYRRLRRPIYPLDPM